MLRWISGEVRRSLSKGPPGASRIMKKQPVMMTNSTGIVSRMRRAMNLNMLIKVGMALRAVPYFSGEAHRSDHAFPDKLGNGSESHPYLDWLGAVLASQVSLTAASRRPAAPS